MWEDGKYTQTLLHTQVQWLSWGQAVVQAHRATFSWTAMFTWKNNQWWSFRLRESDNYCIENEKSEPVTLRKTEFVANDKIQIFMRKLEFWKISIYLYELDSFLVGNDFSVETGCDVNTCQRLEVLHNSANQCFPNDFVASCMRKRSTERST